MIILLAWLTADFISGLVHWWEDRAIIKASRFEFINGIRSDNERHHKMPGFFLRLSWWENINTTAPFAWIMSLFFFSDPYVPGASFLGFVTLFLGFGNLVHRWAHDGNAPRVARWAQKIGLFISPEQHVEHHYLKGELVSRQESRIRYCVMTSWLNPTLDRIQFFKMLDRVTKEGTP